MISLTVFQLITICNLFPNDTEMAYLCKQKTKIEKFTEKYVRVRMETINVLWFPRIDHPLHFEFNFKFIGGSKGDVGGIRLLREPNFSQFHVYIIWQNGMLVPPPPPHWGVGVPTYGNPGFTREMNRNINTENRNFNF